MKLFLLLTTLSVLTSQGAPSNPTGFYPLWENTGFVEEAGRVRVSTTGVHASLGGRAHVGVLPLPFLY